MKYLTIISSIFLFISCAQVEQKQQEDVKDEGLPDLSVFHLPSKWTTHNNEEIALSDLRGNVLVMVMIYTSCKMACPRLVADMRSIESKIADHIDKNIKLVLVSIDPETDTPERLKEFAIENEMDKDHWLFLRSDEENTREFAAVLAVKYKQISPLDFSHSNIISVFDTNGELVHQQEGLGVDNEETIEKILALTEKGS